MIFVIIILNYHHNQYKLRSNDQGSIHLVIIIVAFKSSNQNMLSNSFGTNFQFS